MFDIDHNAKITFYYIPCRFYSKELKFVTYIMVFVLEGLNSDAKLKISDF